MNKQLQFIQSCVRQGISTEDIGYLTKWHLQDEVSDEKYFKSVMESIDNKFFDTNNRIKSILVNYNN